MLGPNGAGKTTLLRILATLLRPSGGEVVGARLLAAARGLEAARADRLPRPRAAALPRPLRAREPALPRPPARARRRRRPRRGSRSCWRRPGWSAAPTSASPSSRPGCASGWRSAAASCTSRSCCCSTSPTPTSTPRGASWPAALIGPGGGRTRVIVTHDPDRFLPEADQVLRLGIGETGGGRVTPSRAAFAAILGKDLRSELRTLQSLPAMALFAVTTFVIFRFGLDRTQPLRQPRRRRALGDAAVRRRARHQPPLRRRARGGRLRRDPAGADRPQRPLRRQGGGAARSTCWRWSWSRCRSSPSSSSTRRRRCGPLVAVLLLADLGLAATGTLISSMAVNSRARDLLVPLVLLPLVVPLMIAATGATEPLLAAGRSRLRPLRNLADGARPIRSDLRLGRLRGVRLPPGGLTARPRPPPSSMYGKGLRPLSIATVAMLAAVALAGLLLRAARRRPGLHPEDLLPARAAGDRRRWSGSSSAASSRSPTCARGNRKLGRLLLRLDPHLGDLRRRGADHRRDLGQGLLGPLVGLGRADPGQLPDRLPPLRDLLPLPLRDRGPRAPGAATPRSSRSPPAPSCRSTSSPCGWPQSWSTRASSPPPTAACRAR